jgi:hypothetical protein
MACSRHIFLKRRRKGKEEKNKKNRKEFPRAQRWLTHTHERTIEEKKKKIYFFIFIFF